MVEKWRGTVLTDEGDFKDDDEKSALIKFYNLGFEKYRSLYQCDKNDPNKIDFFDPFCPKLITTRKQFKDQALESRCLTHIAKVTKRKDIPILLPNEFYEEQKILRNKLLKFRFDYYFKIDVSKIEKIDLGNIEPRLKQATLSYSSLFSNIPEVLDEFKMFLVEYQKELIEDRANSYDGYIVNIIYDMICNGEKIITSGKIVEKIKEAEPRSKVNPGSIGRQLKSFGFDTENVRFDGKRGRAIIFDVEVLGELFKKYIPEFKVEQQKFMEQMEQQTLKELKVDKIEPLDMKESSGGTVEQVEQWGRTGGGKISQTSHQTPKLSPSTNDNILNPQVFVPSVPTMFAVPTSVERGVVLDTLKDIQEYLKPVPFHDLVIKINQEVTTLPEEQIQKILSLLMSDGTIFSPKPGMYEIF